LTRIIWLIYDTYEYSVRILNPFYSDWIFNKQMIKGEVKQLSIAIKKKTSLFSLQKVELIGLSI